jgi:hypothetical protein
LEKQTGVEVMRYVSLWTTCVLLALAGGTLHAQVGHSVAAESCTGNPGDWTTPGTLNCGSPTSALTPGDIDYSRLPLSDYVKLKTFELGTQLGTQMLSNMAADGMKKLLNGDPEAAARRARLIEQTQEQERLQRERERQRRREILSQLLSGQDRLGALALRFAEGQRTDVGQVHLVFGDSNYGNSAPSRRATASAPTSGGYGIPGLPGIYTGGSRQPGSSPNGSYGIQSLPGANLQTNSPQAVPTGGNHQQATNGNSGQGGYGIAGLPGTYTGGPRQEQISADHAPVAPSTSNPANAGPAGISNGGAAGGFGIAGLSTPTTAGAKPAQPTLGAEGQPGNPGTVRQQNGSAGNAGEHAAAPTSPGAPSGPVVPSDLHNSSTMTQLQSAAASSQQGAHASSAEQDATQAGAAFDQSNKAQRVFGQPDTNFAGSTTSARCAPGTADGSVNLRCASTDVVDPNRVKGLANAASSGRIEPKNVQLAAALLQLSSKAPEANRQVILQQALDTANGDASIQADNSAQLPELSPAGLQAFQIANDRYRRATDSRLQAIEKFKEAQERREMASRILGLVYEDAQQAIGSQADAASLAMKQKMLANAFAAARKEDELLHVAAARIDVSDLNVSMAKRYAEAALRTAADRSAIQTSQPDDAQYLFPARGSDPDFLFPDFAGAAAKNELRLWNTYIGSEDDTALDLAFLDVGIRPTYIAMDTRWKMHENNVRQFMHDAGFRDQAVTQWRAIIDHREQVQRDIYRSYTGKEIEILQKAHYATDPAGKRAMENNLQPVQSEMQSKLKVESDKAARAWSSWLDAKEAENSHH